jgi:competence protein ComEA
MSFYRFILAAIAAAAIVSPVFADDAAMQSNSDSNAPAAMQADGQQQAAADQQSGDKININKATAKELIKVKGLNRSEVRAIIAYRKKHGDFKSIDDLANVKALKKVKPEAMKQIQDQLSVE